MKSNESRNTQSQILMQLHRTDKVPWRLQIRTSKELILFRHRFVDDMRRTFAQGVSNRPIFWISGWDGIMLTIIHHVPGAFASHVPL